MALGADRGNVMALVLRGAFRRVVVGLLLGVPLAVGAGPSDRGAAVRRVVLGSARARASRPVSLAICAFLAAIIPAGRAASISPIRALRTE